MEGAVPLEPERWTDANFAELSWHDNHVHSLEVCAGEYGAGELILGLGYILDWLPPKDGRVTFRIAPARLHFREVTDLRVEVDWSAESASLCPFSLGAIRREPHAHTEAMGTHRYALEINWPRGEIRFTSAGFTQTLTGPAVDTAEQLLTTEERRRRGGDAGGPR
jgi:hypothetical protein